MSEQLIDQYVDRGAIAGDTAFFKDQLKEILALFDQINKTRITLGGTYNLKDITAGSKELKAQMEALAKENERLKSAFDEVATKLENLTKARKKAGEEDKKATDGASRSREKLLHVYTDEKKAFEDVNDAAKETITSNAKHAAGVEILTSTYDGLVEQLVRNKKELDEVRSKMKQVRAQFAEGNMDEGTYISRMKELEKELATLTTANQAVNRAIRNFNKEAQAAGGSADEMRAQLNLLLQAYDSLSEADKKADFGTGLKKNIDELSKSITEHEQSTNRFQRNVGNYNTAAKLNADILKDYLADIRRAIDATKQAAQVTLSAAPSNPASGNMRSPGNAPRAADPNAAREIVRYGNAVKDASARVATLTKQEEVLTRVLDSQITGYASAAAQASDYEKTLRDLKAAGLEGTPIWDRFLEQTVELKKGIADLKVEMKALASDTRELDLFVESLSALAQGYQVVASAMELTIGPNEDLQKSIQRLMAIQNIANGIQEIANQATTKGTALNKLYNFIIGANIKVVQSATVAQNGQTAAINGTTVATAGLTRGMLILRGILISLGIGVLIIAVTTLLNKLAEWQASIKDVRDIQKELNEVLLEQIRLQREIEDLTKTDIGTSTQNLKNKLAYSQAYGKSQEEILKNELALLRANQALSTTDFFNSGGFKALEDYKLALEKVGKEYEELITTKKKDGIILDKDDFEKEKGLLESSLALAKQKYSDQYKIVEEYVNDNIAVTSKQFEIEKFYRDRARKDEAALLARRIIDLQAEADYQRFIAETEGFALDKRLKARQKAFDLEKMIIQLQRDFDVKETGLTEEQKKTIRHKASDDIRKNAESTYSDVLRITGDFKKREQEMLQADIDLAKDLPQKTTQEQLLDREDKAFEKRKAYLEEGRDILIRSLEDEKNAKLAAAQTDEERQSIEAEYNNRRLKKELETNELILKAALDVAEKKLKIVQRSGNENEIAELLRQIAELKKQIAELGGTKINLNSDEAQRKVDELVDKIQKATSRVQEAFTAIGDIIGANIDKQKNAIQDQIDALDRQKEKDIEVANATIQNEEEKAAAILTINIRAQAQKEALERRQRELDMQRARFEKASTIGRIIADTAAAVIAALGSKPFTPANIATASLVGAIGAAQLAAAIATPIPRFKHGRTDGPATLGYVGDGGVNEVIYSKDKKEAYLTPAKDTLAFIPQGYGVAPSIEDFHTLMMASAHKPVHEFKPFPVMQDNTEMIKAMAKHMGRVEAAIVKRPEHRTTLTDAGLKTIYKNGDSWYEYINNNF